MERPAAAPDGKMADDGKPLFEVMDVGPVEDNFTVAIPHLRLVEVLRGGTSHYMRCDLVIMFICSHGK